MSTVKSTAATTSLTEDVRLADQLDASSPNPNMVPTVRFGIITRVDLERNMIMAVGEEDDPLGGGFWIPLMQSPIEIERTHGQIRQGMRVIVFANGTAGYGAIATIIRSEEGSLSETSTENTIGRGLFACFPPGIGIG